MSIMHTPPPLGGGASATVVNGRLDLPAVQSLPQPLTGNSKTLIYIQGSPVIADNPA